MISSGCLGTNDQPWALMSILNALENSCGNSKILLENWCLVGGKLAQPFLFFHAFLKTWYHVKTLAILNWNQKHLVRVVQAVVRELCHFVQTNY